MRIAFGKLEQERDSVGLELEKVQGECAKVQKELEEKANAEKLLQAEKGKKKTILIIIDSYYY